MPTELRPAQAETLSNPGDLITGHPLPTRAHTFTRPDGTKMTVLLQGISYARKSELDAARRMDLAESQKRQEAKTDLYLPQLIAEAARNVDGSRAFPRPEDAMLFAIKLAAEYGDGEIHKGYNTVLELSGWGDDAEADAGKS